jgi:nucleoside-diphosphate-sugar epimerase
MSKVAIIGCGFVGRGWAVSFARAGHDVALWDREPDAAGKALAYIEGILPDLEANDLLDGGSIAEVRARMSEATTLEEALGDAIHLQENTPENVETKRQVFAWLDAVAAPDAVIASSTSAILPSLFTEHLRGLPRRPSDQSALSHSRRRSGAGAVDGAGGRRADRRPFARRRPCADRDAARDRWLRHESDAGRAAGGGVPPRGRGLRQRR